MVKRNHKAYYNQTLRKGIVTKKEKHQKYYSNSFLALWMEKSIAKKYIPYP